MARYEVGFIYGRCFVQKRLDFSQDCNALPLPQTGFSGEIHDVRRLLETVRFPYSQRDLEQTLENFSNAGHCTLLSFRNVEAEGFVSAIDLKEREAENVIGSICVASANPAVSLCAFASGTSGSGLKFYVPQDRQIRHGTNVPGFLNALPDIEKKAQSDTKFALLLRLFRASLRERDIDNQILFQLILLEEASDSEEEVAFADRLRKFSERIGFRGDLEVIATECGVQVPAGKDVIDLLVKLRNAAAHNGNISDASLKQYGGDWVVPLLGDKVKLHKLVTEALRYMFCCLVGHTRDRMFVRITEQFFFETGPYARGWQVESLNVFEIALPDLTTGACGANTDPVYRLWNQRADSNHRYTTNQAVKQDMLGRGWLAEGYGPDAVVMCAPR